MTSAARESRMPAIPLAGGELRDARHVCGSFDGTLEAHRVLMPFIVDGIERGERAVHVVDPERRATHAEWLASAGVDVERTLETGQLEIHTWQDVYLNGGRFDRASVRSFVLQSLAAGRAGGFPLTRFIGYMDWALQKAPGVEDLVAYESEIDSALRGVADPVICVYDLERHPAGAMAKVLAAHPLGVIDGDLRPSHAASPNARDRILRAASQLFARNGIGPTGVDTLIASAGVAKATFYRHFPSKDDLIVAWLLDRRSRWVQGVALLAEERARSPREVIPAFFDAVAEWLEAEDYRGCPYLNTAVEIGDTTHPALTVVRDYLTEIEGHIRAMLTAMGRRDAADLAPQVQALLAGSITLSVARRTTAKVFSARAAAMRLIGRGERPPCEPSAHSPTGWRWATASAPIPMPPRSRRR